MKIKIRHTDYSPIRAADFYLAFADNADHNNTKLAASEGRISRLSAAIKGGPMKVIQIIPLSDDKPTLKNLLKDTERQLRGRGTTFKRQREGRWVHARYPGWINWDLTKGGIVVAEVQSKRPDTEWQLLQAFVGYVDRHIGQYVQSISIIYR